jgi:hypothetical protein
MLNLLHVFQFEPMSAGLNSLSLHCRIRSISMGRCHLADTR